MTVRKTNYILKLKEFGGKNLRERHIINYEKRYGERQGRARYIIENEFNDTEASCHSIEEGIQWIRNLLNEYRSRFDLAYLKGTVQHIRVPVIEDDDGDTEEDWNGDIQYLESDELEWSDDDDDDDDDEE